MRRRSRYRLPRPIEIDPQPHRSDAISEVLLWVGLATLVISVAVMAVSQ